MYNRSELFKIAMNCKTEKDISSLRNLISQYKREFALTDLYMVVGILTFKERKLK